MLGLLFEMLKGSTESFYKLPDSPQLSVSINCNVASTMVTNCSSGAGYLREMQFAMGFHCSLHHRIKEVSMPMLSMLFKFFTYLITCMR